MIRLKGPIADQLRTYAAQTGRPVDDILRDAVTAYLHRDQNLTSIEVARILGVSKATVGRLVADGELKAINVARRGKPRLRYRPEDVIALQDARTYRAGRTA